MEFAIVDIETTGGSATYHRIVEIAIVIHDGEKITQTFQTLINPERNIPPQVSLIHGITDDMVADAPKFFEVAKTIYEMTENRIFVAHSVNFDFSFIKKEFESLGGQYQRKKLCTVRLAKQIIPGYRSYSLGSLCGKLGIPIENRHRAMGDCYATSLLFSLLLEKDPEQKVIAEFLNRKSRQMSLPPNVDKKAFERIPHTAGVYFFHDHQGKVIYVGKANNLKERVNEHFLGNTHTKSRQMFLSSIFDVSFEETGHELTALLLENESIKKHFPKFNRTNKTFELNHGIYTYEDQNGYMRAIIGKAGKRDRPITIFKSFNQATTALLRLSMQHRLCLKLNGLLHKNETACQYGHRKEDKCIACHQQDPIVYNRFFQSAMNDLLMKQSYIIKMAGRSKNEDGFVFVEKGKFLGFGFIDKDMEINDLNDIKDSIRSCYDTQDSQTIIQSFLKKAKIEMESPILVYSL